MSAMTMLLASFAAHGLAGVAAWGPIDSSLGLTPAPSSTPLAVDPNMSMNTVSNVFFGEMSEHLPALSGIFAIVAIALGLTMAAAGYQLFTPACFVCGFFAGGLVTARLVENGLEGRSYVVTVSWICFIFGGLVAGAIAAAVASVGIIVAVVAGSVLLAFVVNAAAGSIVYPSNPTQFLGILVICFAVLGGILVWSFEKPMLVTITSLVGAGLVIWGVGRFAGHFPSGQQLDAFQRTLAHHSWLHSVPGAWWGYLVGFLLCTALGVAVQYRKTSGDKHLKRSGRSLKLDMTAFRDGHYRDLLSNNNGRRQRPPPRVVAPRRSLSSFFV